MERLEEVKSLVEVTQGLRCRVEDLNSNAPFIFTLPFAQGPLVTLTLTWFLEGVAVEGGQGGQGSTAEATGHRLFRLPGGAPS